jgi:hypothetical protein
MAKMSDFDQQPTSFTSTQRDSSQQLSSLVAQEARRVLTEEQLRPNPTLVAEGWERRFIADARQAKEAIELYSQLGFEVLAEPVQASEMGDNCQDCQALALLQFKTIYTRKKVDSRR